MDSFAAQSFSAPAAAATATSSTGLGVSAALQQHWPEYLMEAAELGVFMISAALFVALLFYPNSPAVRYIPDALVRRVLTGIAMGVTAIGIVYSPWGQRSGAHFNPCVTLTFWHLGKVAPWDAAFYVVAQFVGAILGVVGAAAILGGPITHPEVNYVATVPGAGGPLAAFVAELLMSFGLMAVVLIATNTPRLARYTGLLCGALVATYICIEAPISGMSMNPARSFAPAFIAQIWSGLWVYFTAPPLGMLLAAEAYVRAGRRNQVDCAKLHHQNNERCIFCEYQHA
jgi:aquaporin Z